MLELYAVLRLPLPGGLLAQLVTAVEQLGVGELEHLDPYLDALRAEGENLGAAGHRTQQALLQLQRVLQT